MLQRRATRFQKALLALPTVALSVPTRVVVVAFASKDVIISVSRVAAVAWAMVLPALAAVLPFIVAVVTWSMVFFL